MTGISDVARNGRDLYAQSRSRVLAMLRVLLPSFLLDRVLRWLPQQDPVMASIPGPGPFPREKPAAAVAKSTPAALESKAAAAAGAAGDGESKREGFKWGLLLPICSRCDPSGFDGNWQRLRAFADSLHATTDAKDRALLTVHVAIDNKDAQYDSDAARERMRELFPDCKVPFNPCPA
jgi:hypothetical protein